MPIYEYRCTACGHRFERWQKMSDPDPENCPECEKREVERIISAVGFRLKGSGWYETDFKSSNRHNVAGDSKPDSKEASSSGSGEKKKSKETSGGEKNAGKPDKGKSSSSKSDTAA